MVFIVEADSEEEVQEVLEGLPLSGVARTNVRRLHTLEDLRSPEGHAPKQKREHAKRGLAPDLWGTLAAQGHERGSDLRDDGPMGESQLAELRNMRVLLEEARVRARNLAYHRRARLEEALGRALEEVDRQIEELRSEGRG